MTLPHWIFRPSSLKSNNVSPGDSYLRQDMICIMKDDIYILEYLVMPLQSLQPLQSVRDGYFYSNHKIWKHIVGLVYYIIIPIADTQTDAV